MGEQPIQQPPQEFTELATGERSEDERRIDLARQELARFVENPGVAELASLYHVELPSDQGERLQVLQQTAATYWDFRKGAERQATDWNVEGALGEEGSEAWNAVFSAANKLGQVESSTPSNRKPSYAVVLGGANKAPYDRLRHLEESLDDYGMLVYLGSSRSISDAEREKAKDYAPDAQTEYDLGCGAIETQHSNARVVNEDTTVRNGDTWAYRLYEFEVEQGQPDGTTATVTKHAIALSTPIEIHTGEDGKTRRATTHDNYRFFAERAELVEHPDATVVADTNAFYTPAQHLVAVQELTLAHGVQVETIGPSAEYTGVKRLPSQLLQEDKSGIDAAVKLERAIAGAESRLQAA
jgi:hypothetical protein